MSSSRIDSDNHSRTSPSCTSAPSPSSYLVATPHRSNSHSSISPASLRISGIISDSIDRSNDSSGKKGTTLHAHRSSSVADQITERQRVDSWNVISPRRNATAGDEESGGTQRSMASGEDGSTVVEDSLARRDDTSGVGVSSDAIRTDAPYDIDSELLRPTVARRRSYFCLSPLWKNVIRCVVAYYLASLFTFNPHLASSVGKIFGFDAPLRNGHIVATVAVYFNPAKTVGEMIEADLLILGGVVYSAALCFSSMTFTVYMDSLDRIGIAHIAVLILWLGGGLSLVAYTKVERNRPIYTTICSLVSLIVVIVITKEGTFHHLGRFSTQLIGQICLLVLIGTVISNFVCFFVWPTSSSTRLKNDIVSTLSSFSTLLSLMTSAFLPESEKAESPSRSALVAAINVHSKAYSSLAVTFSTAYFEYPFSHAQYGGDAIASLTRFAQLLVGLRGSLPADDSIGKNDELTLKVKDALKALVAKTNETLESLQQFIVCQTPSQADNLSQLRDDLTYSLTSFSKIYFEAISGISSLLPLSTPPAAYISDPFSDKISNSTIDEVLFKRYYYYGVNLSALVAELPKIVDMFILNHPRRTSNKRIREVFPSTYVPLLASRPLKSTTWRSYLSFTIWKALSKLRSPRIRFAAKTGIGAMVLAAPAFYSQQTRAEFLRWRGEWAIISYMIVMNQTEGATNLMAFWRIIGTVSGSAVAVLTFTLLRANSTYLSLFSAAFSAPIFWLMLSRPSHAPSSRFVLLTYNLTCLYAYNLREGDGELNVWEIAGHRSVAVLGGVVWGLLITMYVWPIEARRELRRCLSQYFLNLGHLYQRLVESYSSSKPSGSDFVDIDVIPDERTSLLRHGTGDDDDDDPGFVKMEIDLQKSLNAASELLAQAFNEFRLKGAFPVSEYRDIISSSQRLLDLLSSTSARSTGTAQSWRSVVVLIRKERREMVGNVLLYLSILSSTILLKQPLPVFLPPCALSRETLIRKLRSLPRGSPEYLAYFAYVLTMKEVIEELEFLGNTAFRDLFGTVGGSTAGFEALFI